MKVNVTLQDELVSRIDNFADENYMSRSGFLTLASVQYLNTQDTMRLIRDMSLAMRKIADTGTVDPEVMSQLEDFERFSKMLIGQK